MPVADEGASGDEAAGDGEPLEEAEGDEGGVVAGQGAADGGEGVAAQGQESGVPAVGEGVHQRPPEESGEGEGGQIQAQGLGQQGAGDTELRLHVGEGGEVGVDGEGADHGQQGDHDHQPPLHCRDGHWRRYQSSPSHSCRAQ